MKRVQDIDLKYKTVILRCDLNVPVEDGKIMDNSKILKSAKTIKYLLDQKCKIVILSHFGRIKSEEDKKKNTLKPVARELANILNHKVKFVDNCYGDKVKELVKNATIGDILVLENTRIMDIPDKLESSNNEELAKYFASLGDVFVNDAFGSMHRAHASTAGIAKYLPHVLGYLVVEELNKLDILVNNTPHPFTVFMGGAKVDDKLPIIKKLIDRCDYVLLGGGIANSFLKAKGMDVGTSVATSDENVLNELKELMEKYSNKLVFPVDFVTENNIIYDVGTKTIEEYKKYIEQSKVVFVNGTCGKFEDDKFGEGTKKLFDILKDSSATVIVGGGDTASAAKKYGHLKSFYHISSGGGATLEYIADKNLAALDWMK